MDPRGPATTEAYPSVNDANSPSTLLCVDDEPGILAALSRVFDRHRYRVLTAGSGREALDILQREPVDLILSDVRMPEMDGIEFLERARDGWPDVVRLLLTGHPDIDTIAAVNRGGIFRYVAKPWVEEDLLSTVRHALERSVLEGEKQRLELRSAQQHAELCALNATLELKIEARMGELERANQALARDVDTSMHDHRESVEALRQSTQLLDNIVDNIPTAVQLKSVHDGFRVVMWNKAAEVMYGLPRDLAVGRNVHDLWPKEDADRMHAADCELVASGGVRDYPDRIHSTKHRGSIHTHTRKVALSDASGAPTHLLIVADDITARIATETEIRESEARFRSLTKLSSDWYWEQDDEFRGTHRTFGVDSPAGAPLGKFYGERRWEIKNATPLKGTWDDHKATLDAHLPYRDFGIQDRAGRR